MTAYEEIVLLGKIMLVLIMIVFIGILLELFVESFFHKQNKRLVRILDLSGEVFDWISDLTKKYSIMPRYSEISISLTCILFGILFIFKPQMREELLDMYPNGTLLAVLILGCIFSTLVCLFFRSIRPSLTSPVLIFPTMVNFSIAFAAYLNIDQTHIPILDLFPVINLLIARDHLLGLIKVRKDHMRAFSDYKIRYLKILTGTVFMTAIFFALEITGQYHWSILFSICLAYATVINDTLTDTIILPLTGWKKSYLQ